MNAFEARDQADDVKNARDKAAQIRSAAMVIKAKCEELNTMRQAWVDAVAAGTYQQADVDALDALKADLTPLYQAVTTYLAL